MPCRSSATQSIEALNTSRCPSARFSSEQFLRSRGVFLEVSLKADASAAEFLEDAPTRHGFDGLVLSRKR